MPSPASPRSSRWRARSARVAPAGPADHHRQRAAGSRAADGRSATTSCCEPPGRAAVHAQPDDSEGRRRAIQINNLLFSSFLTQTTIDAGRAARELNLVDTAGRLGPAVRGAVRARRQHRRTAGRDLRAARHHRPAPCRRRAGGAVQPVARRRTRCAAGARPAQRHPRERQRPDPGHGRAAPTSC
jgi:hypothetical protein